MKTKRLLLAVLFLFALRMTYGQGVKNKAIFGKHYITQNNTNLHSSFKQGHPQQRACNTITSFDCRNIPTGLVWDGTNFWLVDTGYIYKVSTAGIFLDSIPNPAPYVSFLKGGDLAYDGNHLWYADEQSSQLFEINPSTHTVMQKINLPEHGKINPNGFAIAWDGTNLWHCTYDPPTLYKLSAGDGHLLESVAMDKEILTLEWVKGELFGLGDSAIYRINTLTGMATDSATWCVPFALGTAWDGTSFWNVSGASEIYGFPTGGENKVFKMNADVNLSVSKNSTKQETGVYPNPATENVWIKGDRISQIEIYDVTGSLVYKKSGMRQSSPFEIAVSTFPKGMYLTKIYDESGISTKKLIVQ